MKGRYQSQFSTMNKVTGILLLCTAIMSMAAGSLAWYAIPDAAAVARQATIRNNRLNQLVQLLRLNVEKDLSEFPEGINLRWKTPSNDKDKMENEDFNEWVNDVFSFDPSHRINTGGYHGQGWDYPYRLY